MHIKNNTKIYWFAQIKRVNKSKHEYFMHYFQVMSRVINVHELQFQTIAFKFAYLT